jgi:uncharacterized membrane protein
MVRHTYKEHLEGMSASDRLALLITKYVGTMWTAYAFAALTVISLPAAILSHDPIIIVAWIAQTFLQLVLLPIIIVGQNLQNRHTEIQSSADYETNLAAKAEIEALMTRLGTLEEQKIDKIMGWMGVLLRAELARASEDSLKISETRRSLRSIV